MIIYIGADHRGYELKEYFKNVLHDIGYTVIDVGNVQYDEHDDYVDYAVGVAEKVSSAFDSARGVLLCGSGVGVSVVANKFPHIRCALVGNGDQAFDARNDDDANVLALGANYLTQESAKKILLAWLETPFQEEERYVKRLRKLETLELKLLRPFIPREEDEIL